jgi:ribonuclease HI
MITYHTDGSCRPTNPGPGGYAVIRDGRVWEIGGILESTNIRMEGQAMLAALQDARGRECIIYSDSEFWINVLTKWAPGWKKKGWKKSSGEIKNLDLVKELYQEYVISAAQLQWVKGHANDEGNILADKYALVGSGMAGNLPGSEDAFLKAGAEIRKNKERGLR